MPGWCIFIPSGVAMAASPDRWLNIRLRRLPGMPQVILKLLAQPAIGTGAMLRAAEPFLQAARHIDGNCCMSVQYPRQRNPRYTELPGSLCHIQAGEYQLALHWTVSIG